MPIVLTISFIALVVIFLASTLTSFKISYEKGYWLFEVFHLSAGFFVAMFFSSLFASERLIVLATLAIGVLWEVFELMRSRSRKLDTLLSRLKIKQGKITLPDTLLDLFLDLAGALLFISII